MRKRMLIVLRRWCEKKYLVPGSINLTLAVAPPEVCRLIGSAAWFAFSGWGKDSSCEDDMLLRIHKVLLQKVSSMALLILVPRHPERFELRFMFWRSSLLSGCATQIKRHPDQWCDFDVVIWGFLW